MSNTNATTPKTKTQIITDPAVLRQIARNQPRASLEEMRRSVLEGINSSNSRKVVPSK
ncbi:hypothetical protein [Phragmitibacter flavus]|uniref:hypothetical protein n=1 Tax=Phragmitibacter flavus TaxID=2576071 RepID=UPI00197DDC2E|nr:hypothetical protein [Phragmitibacter flavus]